MATMAKTHLCRDRRVLLAPLAPLALQVTLAPLVQLARLVLLASGCRA